MSSRLNWPYPSHIASQIDAKALQDAVNAAFEAKIPGKHLQAAIATLQKRAECILAADAARGLLKAIKALQTAEGGELIAELERCIALARNAKLDDDGFADEMEGLFTAERASSTPFADLVGKVSRRNVPDAVEALRENRARQKEREEVERARQAKEAAEKAKQEAAQRAARAQELIKKKGNVSEAEAQERDEYIEVLKSYMRHVRADCRSDWTNVRNAGDCQQCIKQKQKGKKGFIERIENDTMGYQCENGGHWICWGVSAADSTPPYGLISS
mgnify:CR=1 FL=1